MGPTVSYDARREVVTVDPWDDLPPGWTQLTPPPFRRAYRGLDRRGVAVLGGSTNYEEDFHGDGAAFDPAVRIWRETSAAPLTARALADAVWTGSEIIIWGGQDGSGALNDGAAYKPVARTWRRLAAPPTDLSSAALTVWTGQELVVWGTTDRQSVDVTGAAYDPETDAWRGIAPAPMVLNEVSGLWTGDEVIAYGSRLDDQGEPADRSAKGMAYRPEHRYVEDAPRVVDLRPARPCRWAGTEMVAWDYVVAAAAYEPRENAWRTLPQPPMRTNDFSICNPASVFANGVVFAWFCGEMATFDPVTGVWSGVPNDPVDRGELMTFGRPTGAGSVVLLLVSRAEGKSYSGEYGEMWVYRR